MTSNEIDLYSGLKQQFEINFKSGWPSFGDLLWQLIINKIWKNAKQHCFTPMYDNNGLVLGIVELNEAGYHNTGLYFESHINPATATQITEQLNALLFGYDIETCYNIIMSSK